MQSSKSRAPSHAERLYREVKSAAVAYRFPPGARINEVGLAKQLGASRTPLREALNRLVAEGFLTFERDRGFFCRELSPRQIFELYQFRTVVQTAAVRLACEHATETELGKMESMLDAFDQHVRERDVDHWTNLDEQFHERLTALSRNEEMLRVLKNINDTSVSYACWTWKHASGAFAANTRPSSMPCAGATRTMRPHKWLKTSSAGWKRSPAPSIVGAHCWIVRDKSGHERYVASARGKDGLRCGRRHSDAGHSVSAHAR